MKILILIALTFITFCCVEKQGRLAEPADSLQTNSRIIDKVDNVEDNCNTWLDEADSILANGDYVKYIKKKGRIKIEWGSRSFSRALKHDFDCDASPSSIPTIRWISPKYIGLGYGCGSPCWGTIILPRNLTDSVFEKMYDFEKELNRNLIVYLDDYDRLVIENWGTGQKQEVKTNITCELAFIGNCIDSIRFVNDNLYIKWNNSAGEYTDKDKVDLIKVEI